jgi:hypothetical protein
MRRWVNAANAGELIEHCHNGPVALVECLNHFASVVLETCRNASELCGRVNATVRIDTQFYDGLDKRLGPSHRAR